MCKLGSVGPVRQRRNRPEQAPDSTRPDPRSGPCGTYKLGPVPEMVTVHIASFGSPARSIAERAGPLGRPQMDAAVERAVRLQQGCVAALAKSEPMSRAVTVPVASQAQRSSPAGS